MTLNRKLLRSTKKNLLFYLTASLLTALTIMLWVGAFTVAETMTKTYTELFEESCTEDACFTVSGEITDNDISVLEQKYGLTLEKQIYLNVPTEKTKLRVFADAEKLNLTQITEGKPIAADNEALITYNYAKANGIGIGDELKLMGQSYHVCGYCLKPDYSAMYAEFSDTFPNSESFGIAVVRQNGIERSGSYSSFYSVKYNKPEKEADFRKYIYVTYGTLQYVGINDNPRTGIMISSAKDIKAEFSVYSPIIMLVVIVMTAMVLSRTVRRESKSIGTLLALGYSKSELVRHYLTYALIPSLIGDLLGAVGCVPFAKLFCAYMFSFGEHIEYSLTVPVGILVAAMLIPPAVYSFAAVIVI